MSDYKRNLKSRLRSIEQGSGVGCVTFTFPDASTRGFNFSRQDRAQILVACFEAERARRSGNDLKPSNPRATEIAKLIRKAVSAEPSSKFWRMCGLGMEAAEP